MKLLKNTENLLQKNFEYLIAQQQETMLKQQQTFLTNLQSILINSQQTHSMMESSGPSRQGTNDMSTRCSGSSRQGANSMSLNINQGKSHCHQAGDKRKHPSDDESYDDDDRLSVTAGHFFDVTVDGENELSLYSKKVEKGEGDTSEEGQLYESRYHDLLSVVEDDLGYPIEQQFAEVCHKIWGNSKNNDKLKAEFKSILVPKNCTFMKTPYLNPEIYSRISGLAVNKDKAAQRKQRQTVKAIIPLMKAIVSLKEVEKEIKKKVSPDTFQKLKFISLQLHQSFRVLNASFTDIQRKRKGDVCSSLGRHFKQFSQSDSSEQYLFDEPEMDRNEKQ